MDKFGIFKLLNSFFDFYKQNSQNFEKPSSPPPSDSPPPTFSQNKETPKKKDADTPSLQKTPLQQNMLNVIHSHDQIVNRVKNKK